MISQQVALIDDSYFSSFDLYAYYDAGLSMRPSHFSIAGAALLYFDDYHAIWQVAQVSPLPRRDFAFSGRLRSAHRIPGHATILRAPRCDMLLASREAQASLDFRPPFSALLTRRRKLAP